VGQTQQATHLYGLVQDFVVRAYDALWALLGPQLAKVVGEQVEEWVERVKTGEDIGHWLQNWYGTDQVSQSLVDVVANSEAALENYLAALKQVIGLQIGFRQRTSLVAKVLPKVKFLQLVPAAQLPAGMLLLASFYIVAAGYVVLVAGDHLDVPRHPWPDRTPGVRHVVEKNLCCA
jgi:hypothetical protein